MDGTQRFKYPLHDGANQWGQVVIINPNYDLSFPTMRQKIKISFYNNEGTGLQKMDAGF
jgi:hypothetical protein